MDENKKAQIMKELEAFLKRKMKYYIPIASEIEKMGYPRLKRWKIIENAEVESDLWSQLFLYKISFIVLNDMHRNKKKGFCTFVIFAAQPQRFALRRFTFVEATIDLYSFVK